jgi:hypothetical protein
MSRHSSRFSKLCLAGTIVLYVVLSYLTFIGVEYFLDWYGLGFL